MQRDLLKVMSAISSTRKKNSSPRVLWSSFCRCSIASKAKVNRSMTITMSILFLSLLPGFLFLVIGALTQEAVGYGDGLSILAMGFYMEAYALWKAVGISLTLVTAYVLGQKLLQKHRYKQEQKYEQEQIHKQKQENGQIPKSGVVPFLPFLLTGMVVVLGVL